MISTKGILATGLKKCRPTSRPGSRRSAFSCSSMMLEVLVARIAPGFILGSSLAYSSRLASAFSKMASITTSARATPSPARSICRRAAAACAAFASGSLLPKKSRARSSAGRTYSSARSCSVTLMPRETHQAAISPPITPAPTTCTCLNSVVGLPPRDLRRSCSMKTRTRLRAVGVSISAAIERASASYACCTASAVAFP